MGITVAELYRIGQQGGLSPETPESWEQLMLAADGAGAALQVGVLPGLQGSWTGIAAELAAKKITATSTGLTLAVSQLNSVKALLETFIDGINAAAGTLCAVIRFAQDDGLNVDLSDGQAIPMIKAGGYTYDSAAAEKYSMQIRDIMSEVNNLDGQAASDLRRLLPPPPQEYSELQQAEEDYLSKVSESLRYLPGPNPQQQEQAVRQGMGQAMGQYPPVEQSAAPRVEQSAAPAAEQSAALSAPGILGDVSPVVDSAVYDAAHFANSAAKKAEHAIGDVVDDLF